MDLFALLRLPEEDLIIDFNEFKTVSQRIKNKIEERIEEIKNCISHFKENKIIEHSTMPLRNLIDKGWSITSKSISSETNKHFELVGVKASIGSREVSSWYQPIVKDNVPKTYVFLIKEINKTPHIAVQAVEEDFSWSGPELGPSLHSIDSQSMLLEKLRDLGITSKQYRVIYDKLQSEEGGRFLEQKNRYMLIDLDNSVEVKMTDRFRWMTLYQLKKMTSLECSVNIEARTLLTIASYYKEQE